MSTNMREQFPPITLYLLIATLALASSMPLFSVRFIEQKDSLLVATSNYNYALTSPKLLEKNWRTVSVNGENVFIVTINGEKKSLTKGELGDQDRLFIEGLRDEISASKDGFSHVTSGGTSNGGNFMMSSASSETSTSFSSSASDIQGGSLGGADMSISGRDDSNFSVSKSDLPYNWARVFFNGDLITAVYKDGEVKMKPINSLEADQLEAINRIKTEVKTIRATQSQHFSDTMKQSMDMVSNVFSNVMGNFPKPPSFESAVGNTFGQNFPFGPNNSPFSSSSGWPFAGNGGGAFAFAG